MNKKEGILYLIFGILTTAVDYMVAMCCFELLGMGELMANNIAWVVSVIFAYITNKIFVFQSKSMERKVLIREIFSFFSARVLTLLLADVIIFVAVRLHIGFFWAKIISSVFVVIANYILSKLYIFKKTK